MLLSNINQLVDKINHKSIYLEKEAKILIIPKNPQGTASAEISSEQTGLAILRYHHRLLQGNLSGKRKILETIAHEYEEILKNGEPTEIFSKTRTVLNNSAIRHGDKKNKENVAKLNDKEFEECYDDLYQMLLLCILLNDNKSRMKRVDVLLVRISKSDNY